MFRKMPFLLLVGILGIVLLDDVLPLEVKRVFYACSLSIKSIILFVLPVVIFCLLFKAIFSLGRGATRLVALVLGCVFISNGASVLLGRLLGMGLYRLELPLMTPKQNVIALTPFWEFNLVPLIDNSKAMIAALILGFLVHAFFPHTGKNWSASCERFALMILKGLSFFVPVFVLGFVMKLHYEGSVLVIFRDYFYAFALITLFLAAYLLLVYRLLNRGGRLLSALKNMFPAALSGLTTMSSLASLPLMITGGEANSRNRGLAQAVLPAVVNNHLVGSCIAIPAFAFALLKSQGLAEPGLLIYLQFCLSFVLSTFCVAAVPAGGIFVLLPSVNTYLGLPSESLSLLTALYILMDPIVTCTNVLGNGAFAQGIDKLWSWRRKEGVGRG